RLVGGEIEDVTWWLEWYGVFAIVLSRPVPMLAGVLSCLVGLSHMRPRVFVVAAALGALPFSIVYAVAGSYGSLENPWAAAIVALGMPAAGWAVLRIVEPRRRISAPIRCDGSETLHK
ncbi:MAG: DedA family protein, partial [Chloroflexota bacterium]